MNRYDRIVQTDIQKILEECQDEFMGLSGKSILLTGGSGFIGSYLCSCYAEAKGYCEMLCRASGQPAVIA
ncbi:MAG TPA: hypothetical protein VND43_06530 [Burkholderiales bacterium]|nr:hypothetical protein [Burkholderiales bacterium]